MEVIDPDATAGDTMAGCPGWAAREMLRRRRAGGTEGGTLAAGTALPGAGVLQFMEVGRQLGYRIVRRYMSLHSAGQARIRTRHRVAPGGHDVPEADVRRRFARSHANLPPAILREDAVLLQDDTDPAMPHHEGAILREGEWWRAGACRFGRSPRSHA